MDKLPLEQFFQENEKLIHFASQKASRRFAAAGLADHFDYDEIHGQLREVFIKSYHGFDPERAKFSTYFVTAATNAVTNEIERLYRYEMKTISGSQSHTGEDSEGEWFDSFADESSSTEEEVELQSEINHLRDSLSPMARTLLDYSMSPPDFVKQEFYAQRAQCAFASANGLKTSHAVEIDIKFVANCLKMTVDTPEAQRFIVNAVNEVKTAVANAFHT